MKAMRATPAQPAYIIVQVGRLLLYVNYSRSYVNVRQSRYLIILTLAIKLLGLYVQRCMSKSKILVLKPTKTFVKYIGQMVTLAGKHVVKLPFFECICNTAKQ